MDVETRMAIAKGIEVYNVDAAPVVARGYSYDQADIDAARADCLEGILSDESGRESLAEFYAGLELTEFGNTNVADALQATPEEEHSRGWREGEAIGEAWLVSHKECDFPWPFNRDLRHYRASLPGAELVGFVGETDEDARFAFGQVKTSKEQRNPPQVVNHGETCLISQMLQLRDDRRIKETIVDYLAYRAQAGVPWLLKFRVAAARYFNSGMTEVALFGVLVRDVQPVGADLAGAAACLATDCPPLSRVEFCALYLPLGAIISGPQHGSRGQGSPAI